MATRKPFPRHLDDFAGYARTGVKREFRAAFAAAIAAFPGVKLDYVGYAAGEHYFQERGDAVAYVVPASEGWTP